MNTDSKIMLAFGLGMFGAIPICSYVYEDRSAWCFAVSALFFIPVLVMAVREQKQL